jgi:poly(hydroxyalkanoate) depolymerase family esterase
MNNFADAMRSAMNLMREQKLVDATAVIQDALSGVQPVSSASGSETRPVRLAIEDNKVIDLTAQVMEPETIASAELTADPRSDQFQSSTMAEWNAGPLRTALDKFRSTEVPSFNLDGLRVGRSRKALKIPEGAQYLSRSFACAAGRRNYKLYIPRDRQTGRSALLVMLHGGTQDADDFAAGTRMNALAEEYGFIVVYPRQSKAANASSCWNWFSPDHQMRGHGEPAIIAGITRAIIAECDVDPARVFVAGLSAGGAMAAVMGATYPDLYDAVGVHSGLPYQAAADLPSAFAAMRGDAKRRRSLNLRNAPEERPRVRTIIFHGDADKIVHPSNAANIVDVTMPGESVEGAETLRGATRTVMRDKTGAAIVEHWLVHGSGHAWSGGSLDGTYTDPHGPDASREMLRFFFDEPVG